MKNNNWPFCWLNCMSVKHSNFFFSFSRVTKFFLCISVKSFISLSIFLNYVCLNVMESYLMMVQFKFSLATHMLLDINCSCALSLKLFLNNRLQWLYRNWKGEKMLFNEVLLFSCCAQNNTLPFCSIYYFFLT